MRAQKTNFWTKSWSGLGQEQILNDRIGAMLQFHSLDSLLQMPSLMSVEAH